MMAGSILRVVQLAGDQTTFFTAAAVDDAAEDAEGTAPERQGNLDSCRNADRAALFEGK